MTKRPLIFLGLAIVLAVVVFLLERPERPRIDDARNTRIAPGFDTATIARVEVEQLLDGVDLKREGELWFVAERITPARRQLLEQEGRPIPESVRHPADAGRVRSALGYFSGLEEGIVVSDNPEKASLYQVDRTGVAVRAFDEKGRAIIDVIIGKNGPDFGSTYLKRATEPDVLLVNKPMVGAFSPAWGDWRERQLWQLDPKIVTGVEVVAPAGSWKMARAEDGVWNLSAPKAGSVDADRATKLVRGISRAVAADFADGVDLKTAGLEPPALTLIVSAQPDKTLKLFIGKKDDKGRAYARLDPTSEIVFLPKEFIDAIPPETPKY